MIKKLGIIIDLVCETDEKGNKTWYYRDNKKKETLEEQLQEKSATMGGLQESTRVDNEQDLNKKKD